MSLHPLARAVLKAAAAMDTLPVNQEQAWAFHDARWAWQEAGWPVEGGPVMKSGGEFAVGMTVQAMLDLDRKGCDSLLPGTVMKNLNMHRDSPCKFVTLNADGFWYYSTWAGSRNREGVAAHSFFELDESRVLVRLGTG